MTGPGSQRLPCGTPVDDLLTQVAERRPARDPVHQSSCPHCRAALGELEEIWQPVHGLAAEDVRAPASVLSAVMDRVRALPRESWYASIPTDGGTTRIAARVIGAVARLAAEEVPYVSLALGGGRTARSHSAAQIAGSLGESATDVGVAGTHVVVDVKVVVTIGSHLPAVGEQVRRHVSQRVASMVGLRPDEVNVNIVDVQEPDRSRWV